jgi:hypothetical protein
LARGDGAGVAGPGYGDRVDVESARKLIATERPRRLRLAELLQELGACDGDSPAGERHETITVGALVDKAAEGGFGFLIGVLALIAIPFFGLSTPFGLAIALLGAQLMFGLHRPWLPRRARRRELSMTMLDRVLGMLSRRTRWLAGVSRRRCEALIFPRLVGLGIVLLALGLSLPLPIPGSNLVFLIPLLMYAIGVLERDGLWIALGYTATLIDMALLVVFGATVVTTLERLWQWLA